MEIRHRLVAEDLICLEVKDSVWYVPENEKVDDKIFQFSHKLLTNSITILTCIS